MAHAGAARRRPRARDRWLVPRWHERAADAVRDLYESQGASHQEIVLFVAVSVPGMAVVAALYAAALAVAR